MDRLVEAEKIWVYQGEHDKEPMLAWEGKGTRPATEAEVLLYERTGALEIELQEQVMRGEEHQPIEFYESDGTLRKLVYDKGDRSVGIFPGYEAEDTLVEDLRSELRRAHPLVDSEPLVREGWLNIDTQEFGDSVICDTMESASRGLVFDCFANRPVQGQTQLIDLFVDHHDKKVRITIEVLEEATT
jgi:hypothetical protein